MKGRGSFLQGLVCMADDSCEQGPSVSLFSAGHRKARCLPGNPAGIQRYCWALPSASPFLSHLPWALLFHIFRKHSWCFSVLALHVSSHCTMSSQGPFISQARVVPCDSIFCHLLESALDSSCFKMAAIVQCPMPCLKSGLLQTRFNSSSLWSVYPHVLSGGVGKGSFLFQGPMHPHAVSSPFLCLPAFWGSPNLI